MTKHHGSRIALAAMMTAGALILTGCSGGGAAGGGGGAGGGATEEFSFTFATSNNLESPYATLANEYMAANPGVTITLNPTPNDKYGETIRTQLQAGNASDVIQTAPGSGDGRSVVPLAEAGFLEPLGAASEEMIPENADSMFKFEDKVYGQPMDFTVIGVVASMGTAAQNGITEFPATMADLDATCASLKGAGKSLFALAGAAPPNVGLTLQSISATRVYADTPDWNQQRADGKVTFADSKGWRDTLQTFMDLNAKGCFQPGAEGGGFDAITNGMAQGQSVASVIPSGSAVEIAQAAPPEANFQALPFPAADGGKPRVLASSNYAISINAASTHKDAASKFVEWLGSAEAQQRFYEVSGLLPAVGHEDLDLSSTLYAPMADLLESKSYSPLPSSAWPNSAVYDALCTGGQGLLTGQMTIDDVLKSLDQAWDS